VKSLWQDAEAKDCGNELQLRVYSSRLLGRDKSLVLHGGGNTSVKITEKNLFGEEEDVLYVKGSGWDLETIAEAGFAPVRLGHLRKLAQLPSLSDPEMVNQLVTHQTRAAAPVPSVEAILHAILPYRFVDHTHADGVVAVTNSVDGEARIREIYGDKVVVVPYVMPGFDLARLCAERFAAQAGPQTIGMALMNHGMFSFGATAKESYERMIALVGMAEDYLRRNGAWEPVQPSVQPAPQPSLPATSRSCARIFRRRPASRSSSRAMPKPDSSPSRSARTSTPFPSRGRRRPIMSSAPSACRWSAATSKPTWRRIAPISPSTSRRRRNARPCSIRRRASCSIRNSASAPPAVLRRTPISSPTSTATR
jgi:rhamnose utilization protein RhaD (predicted bifunctional aldolase and dehydrogenase)